MKPVKDPEVSAIQLKRVAILKEKLRKVNQVRKEDQSEGPTPEHNVYEFELRAFLRPKKINGKKIGCWPCPALDCSQTYSRKSHMKDHVKQAGDARHHVVRSIVGKIRCCYCGDAARDALIIAERQNTEIQYGSEPPSSGSSTPSSESPVPVARGDNGLRPGEDINPTPERRGNDESTKNFATESNLAMNSTVALLDQPCTELGPEEDKQRFKELVVSQTDPSSPLSQKSSGAPGPTTPTGRGTYGRSARVNSQRTAQTDDTVELSAVIKTTDKAPSPALLPTFDHASGMDILPIRHSSLMQRREGATHMTSQISREGFDKRYYHGMGVNGALSGLSDASDYPPSYRSFPLNGRGYTSQGTLLGSRNDPNDWHSTSYSGYPTSHYHNWSAASGNSILNNSYMLDCSGIKVEDPTSGYEMLSYPRHSTALVDSPYASYDLPQQPVSTNSWAHGHAPVRSVNDSPSTIATLLQGTGNLNNYGAYNTRFEPSVEDVEPTTKRGLSVE